MLIEQMTHITQELLLAEFNSILERVIAGEYFLIVSDDGGLGCVLMPYDEASLDNAG